MREGCFFFFLFSFLTCIPSPPPPSLSLPKQHKTQHLPWKRCKLTQTKHHLHDALRGREEVYRSRQIRCYISGVKAALTKSVAWGACRKGSGSPPTVLPACQWKELSLLLEANLTPVKSLHAADGCINSDPSCCDFTGSNYLWATLCSTWPSTSQHVPSDYSPQINGDDKLLGGVLNGYSGAVLWLCSQTEAGDGG